MPQPKITSDEYRGYDLTVVPLGANWRVDISPRRQLLRTTPDRVLAATEDNALAKARAVIDAHLLK